MEFIKQLALQQQILKELQDIPNAPFTPGYVADFIIQKLSEANIPYKRDPYSIIILPRTMDTTKKKFIIMAHTDHPGIVIKNRTEGVFFGTPYFPRLKNILQKTPIPITIFDKQQKKYVSGKIVAVKNAQRGIVTLEVDDDIAVNSVGRYDIPTFKADSTHYEVYNADNGASVATMLAEIITEYESVQPNTYFVFTLHEEVHQISSWHIASRNTFAVTPRDFILNLECLTVNNISDKVPPATYENGLVLQLSNTGCLFGYRFTERNELEDHLRILAKQEGISIQTGVIQDSCDSRPFSFFPLTPHICTLTIPNEFKHNKGKLGEIAAEKIDKKHFEDQLRLLSSILHNNVTEQNSSAENVSMLLRENDTVTDLALMNRKAVLNERLAIAYLGVIKRGYYFPETVVDAFVDLITKVLSYGKYFLTAIFARQIQVQKQPKETTELKKR